MPVVRVHTFAGGTGLLLARALPKGLVDLCQSGAAPLLMRYRYPDRRLLSIADEGLCRPAPAAIEQRVRGRNASVRRVALSHFFEQTLDRFGRMPSRECSDLGNPTWTAAGITRLARCPSSVRKPHCLISPCSEASC
jgi:hypothetical protein